MLNSLGIVLSVTVGGGDDNSEGFGVTVRVCMLPSALLETGGALLGGGCEDGGGVIDEDGGGVELYFP